MSAPASTATGFPSPDRLELRPPFPAPGAPCTGALASELAARHARLGSLLAHHEPLWRPAPFRHKRPEWCARSPALAASALALDDEALQTLEADEAARLRWLAAHFPELAELGDLIHFEPAARTSEPLPPRLERDVPGRKLVQIAAFAGAIGRPRGPLLEWCAGKGHLGRVLGARWKLPVLSLEHDGALCREGERLAARAGIDQRFACANVLAPGQAERLAGRHVVALHACGDLHRALLEAVAIALPPAVDLAPCCFHKVADAGLAAMSSPSDIRLDRDVLRQSVADTATAPAREIRLRVRAMAWKLGFTELLRGAPEPRRPRALAGVPQVWLKESFEEFCRRLARRESVPVPAGTDWAALEASGWERRAEAARLGLVRAAFRRPLEAWLALDRARFLEQLGYTVRVVSFCDAQVSPRNLLISARS